MSRITVGDAPRGDRRRGRVGAQGSPPRHPPAAEASWRLVARPKRAASRGVGCAARAVVARGHRARRAPAVAHAWTPGTHVFLGEAVLRSLALLPAAIAELLRAFPYDFLYGSIAADTSIAKKYVPAGRHCHSWTVGLEIHDGGARRAAARVRARLPGAPRRRLDRAQLLRAEAARRHGEHVVARAQLLGEPLRDASRAGVRPAGARPDPARSLARRRAARPHPEPDDLQHADEPPDLPRHGASSPTTKSWQRIFQLMTENSRWDLADADVGALPRPRVRLHHRLPASSATASRAVSRSIRRATRRCGWRSRCGARRCARAATELRARRGRAPLRLAATRRSATRATSTCRSTTPSRAASN